LCFPGGCAVVNGVHPLCTALSDNTVVIRTTCGQNSVLRCREGGILVALDDCGAQSCTVGQPPPPGAEWCSPAGKCIPYASEPVAACQ
jgi:hypothetical protein